MFMLCLFQRFFSWYDVSINQNQNINSIMAIKKVLFPMTYYIFHEIGSPKNLYRFSDYFFGPEQTNALCQQRKIKINWKSLSVIPFPVLMNINNFLLDLCCKCLSYASKISMETYWFLSTRIKSKSSFQKESLEDLKYINDLTPRLTECRKAFSNFLKKQSQNHIVCAEKWRLFVPWFDLFMVIIHPKLCFRKNALILGATLKNITFCQEPWGNIYPSWQFQAETLFRNNQESSIGIEAIF